MTPRYIDGLQSGSRLPGCWLWHIVQCVLCPGGLSLVLSSPDPNRVLFDSWTMHTVLDKSCIRCPWADTELPQHLICEACRGNIVSQCSSNHVTYEVIRMQLTDGQSEYILLFPRARVPR